MNIRFNTLCSLIKKLQINTKNDIKRLERVIPSVITAINEHPAHTSLLLYHLSKATSLYKINHDCKTCKGLCNITFHVLSPHTYEVLDRLSPKALAQILKIYSNCINDTNITDQIQLRLCYFMLSYLNFPVHYINHFNSWSRQYKKSSDDYLNLNISAPDQSKFYLPLVIHDVADLIQSLFQFISHSKSTKVQRQLQYDFKTKLVLDISFEYIDKLLQSDLGEKDIHGITRIFYYYRELNYFNENVHNLWMLCMDKFLNSMNLYDICTMLHSIQSPLDKYINLIQLLESRLNELLLMEHNLKSFSMILNALFKCDIYNSSIPRIAYSQISKLVNCNTKSSELFQVIKMLIPFGLNVDDMILLLHGQTSKSNNLFRLFDLHDITFIINWYTSKRLDTKHIIEAVLELDNLIDYAGTSKFDNLYRFAVQLNESSLLNDHLTDIIYKSLVLYLNDSRARLDKLVRLYEIFQNKRPSNSKHCIEDRIVEIIQAGNLIESFKTPLHQYPKFSKILKKRIETDLNELDYNFLIKLCRNGASYNLSLLPIESIIKQCNLEQISSLLAYIPESILPVLDIQSAIDNTIHGNNKNLALCIYKCVLNGVRDENAGKLIDYFIECGFCGFKELMMICIIANLPNISNDHSIKIVDYFHNNYTQLSDCQTLKILNKLMPISLKKSYDLANKLVPVGTELLNRVELSNEVAKFVSYLIKLDRYRNKVIYNAVDMLLDYNNNGLDSNIISTIGIIGMQYWDSKCTFKWMKHAIKICEEYDLYTHIQLRMFVNPTVITLAELRLMNNIINNIKNLEFNNDEKPIIREVEESINYSTTKINIKPKVDILILCK